jgi:hypothetical protein
MTSRPDGEVFGTRSAGSAQRALAAIGAVRKYQGFPVSAAGRSGGGLGRERA